MFCRSVNIRLLSSWMSVSGYFPSHAAIGAFIISMTPSERRQSPAW